MTFSALKAGDHLNSRLAWLLGTGTWVSCGLIAAGMILSSTGDTLRQEGPYLISAGIVLLIALPTLRVVVMGIWFLLNREVDFALVAALVLAIIVASTLFGVGAI